MMVVRYYRTKRLSTPRASGMHYQRTAVSQRGLSLVRLLLVLVLLAAVLALLYLFLLGNKDSVITGLSPDIIQSQQPASVTEGKQNQGAADAVEGDSATESQSGEDALGAEQKPTAEGSTPQSGIPPAISGSRLDSGPPRLSLPDTASEIMPELNNSDETAKESLLQLGSQQLLLWLVDDELLRKFVVTVDNMAAGKLPRKHLFFKNMDTPFRAVEEGDSFWLSGYNYARYNAHISMLSALEPEQLVNMYQQFYPLLQRAYAELGYPRRSFHQRLLEAVDQVLQAPVREQPLELVRPSVMYTYADPQLEQLSAVDKQLLRLGPDHSRSLKQLLSELRSELARFKYEPQTP